MKNLTLFVATVAGYFGIWWYIGGAPEGVPGYALRFGVLALLSAPWNIRGNVWTILGNAESEGSIYSLFSLYQKAAHTAIACSGILLYQKAGDDAFCGIGVLFHQNADNDAKIAVGAAVWQEAKTDATLWFGVSACQIAGRNADILVGITLFQTAGEAAFILFGIALYQNAKKQSVTMCGIAFHQNAQNKTKVGLGISLWQSVSTLSFGLDEAKVACVAYGVAVYQTVPVGRSITTKSRTFGIGEFSSATD